MGFARLFSKRKKNKNDVEKGVDNAAGDGDKKSKPNKRTAQKTQGKTPEPGKGNKGLDPPTSNFPCCFDIPLDIVMEGFALFDMIYFGFFALAWGVLVATEPFAGRDPSPNYKTNITDTASHINAILDFTGKINPGQNDKADNQEEFSEPPTTLGPLLYNKDDEEVNAAVYSRIASVFQQYAQEVDDGCNRYYYRNYLFTHQLKVTRKLFEEMSVLVITGSLIYVFLAAFLLTTICCFRGFIFSKVLIILLWYAELIPTYIFVEAIIMSQSQRLCILQYGIGKSLRGQTWLFWLLLWPFFTFKPYEFFIWFNYICAYFQNKDGGLHDESYYSVDKTIQRKRRLSLLEDGSTHARSVPKSQLFRQIPKLGLEQVSGTVSTSSRTNLNRGDKNRQIRSSNSSD